MRLLICLCFILSICFIHSEAEAGKVRVVYKADDSIAVVRPVRSKREGETDDQYYEAVFNEAMEQPDLIGMEFSDIDEAEVPTDREDRMGWEKPISGKGIKVNKVKAQQIRDEEESKRKDKALAELGLTQADINKIKVLP